MSELDIFNPGAMAPQQPAPIGHMRLTEWADEARAASGLAKALCQTPFAGQFQGNPAGGTAAILRGAELGLTPVTALGAFDLIQGTVAPKALTLRALAQSAGHRVWVELSTPAKCIVKGVRRGESIEQQSEWTIERARQLGVTSKSNWKNQPQSMLLARATAELCRIIAADTLLGIGYSAEELADAEPEPTRSVTRAASTTPKVQRAPKPKPEVPEPDLDEPQPEVSDPAPDRITDAQRAAIFDAFRDAGWTSDARSEEGRTQRLAYMAQILDGEVVESTNDLTTAQASRVLDALRQDAQDAPAGEDLPIEVQE